MGKIRPLISSIEDLRIEIHNTSERKGITYLGPKADIYQAQEAKLGLTRKVLELFSEMSVPTFIVTRSKLITRDLDILQEMAKKGLVEVSISIASPKVQPTLEPGTPTVEERLELITILRDSGIPVSVHLSPIVPYLDDTDEIKQLMQKATDLGASCIYACVLGMADRYFQVVSKSLQDESLRKKISDVYSSGNKRLDVYSADQGYIYDLMNDLCAFSSQHAIPFACVHIPEFDTVERAGHIFRHKLPNIGDLTRHFTRTNQLTLTLSNMLQYLDGFAAVDDDFKNTVVKFWNEGVIFKNTYYHPEKDGSEVLYHRKSSLDLLVTNMRVEVSA
ncbi:SPL family radical SAM protein [Pseudomonas syringae]|uniref:SPL family radical SAM protein n=1 Tax=Pseudomonas syringae TaxID=317 RepID=UPI003F84DFD2